MVHCCFKRPIIIVRVGDIHVLLAVVYVLHYTQRIFLLVGLTHDDELFLYSRAGVTNVDDDAFGGDVKLASTAMPYDNAEKFLRNGKSGHIHLGK